MMASPGMFGGRLRQTQQFFCLPVAQAKSQSYFLYSCVSHCQYMNLDT